MAKAPRGFAKTGSAKPAQFAAGGGQNEKGFRQKTLKQTTAAMQGRPRQGGPVKAKPKNKGTAQFKKAGGKSIW